MATLFDPVVLEKKASLPTDVLPSPVVVEYPAVFPTAVLLFPLDRVAKA